MAFYVVSTPIGNLQDISKRALTVLSKVDFIFAEDTRRIKKLLNYFNIHTKTESFHGDSSDKKRKKIITLLKQGKELALVSDAGTPTVSDPGASLIDQIYNLPIEIKMIPIPGPCSIIAALSVSGFPADKFTFLGYTPRKSGKRKKFFQNILNLDKTAVFFSTPHHIQKDLEEIKKISAVKHRFFIAREITKIYQTFYRGSIDKVLKAVCSDPKKGEYTIVLTKK